MPSYQCSKAGKVYAVHTTERLPLPVENGVLGRIFLGAGKTQEEAMENALHCIDKLVNYLARIRLELLDHVPISKGGRGV